jgi:CBS domain-containing protein
MVRRPAVHPPSATVEELRTLFDDEHVHMALLVDGGRLVGTVERADLGTTLSETTAALHIAKLEGRTIAPDAALAEAHESLRRGGRRRLAVTSTDGSLVGLLCLKASGLGFCSDADVGSRRLGSRET